MTHHHSRDRRSFSTVAAAVAATVCFSLGLLPARKSAAEDDASKQTEALRRLEAKELTRLSRNFVLPEEAEINRKIGRLTGLQDDIRDAQRAVEQAEKKVKAKDQLIANYLRKRRQLRMQAANATSLAAHNRAVMLLNELGDRIIMLEKSTEEDDALREARAELMRHSEQFTETVMATRKDVDQLQERYDELAADPDVVAALEQYNAAAETPLELGPTRGFQSRLRRLQVLEKLVHRESIPLRRGPGGLWYVSVVFNGGAPQELAVDTGASLISLPALVAQRAGIIPDEESPVISLEVADGRVVRAHRVSAKTVRVGPFTVKDVDCAVLPAEMGTPTPLLGLSFLGNFSFQLDSAAGRLVISEVGSKSDTEGAVAATATDDDETAADDSSATDAPRADAVDPVDTDQRQEKLTALLALPEDDPKSDKRVTLPLPDGNTVTFQPCVRGPAATLRARFGQPDRIDAVVFRREGREPLEWELWTWGTVRLFVDSTGKTRYWGRDKEQ